MADKAAYQVIDGLRHEENNCWSSQDIDSLPFFTELSARSDILLILFFLGLQTCTQVSLATLIGFSEQLLSYWN